MSTEAGKRSWREALLDTTSHGWSVPPAVLEQIEAKAVAAALSALRVRVEGLPMTFGMHTCWDNHEGPDAGHPHFDGSQCNDQIIGESVHRAAVLAAIDEAMPK